MHRREFLNATLIIAPVIVTAHILNKPDNKTDEKPEYFIGIVPPKEIYNQILGIQQQYGNNKAEPHITIKAQGGLTQDRGWIGEVSKVAKAFSPFPVKLTQTGTFGSDVLFFAVESPLLVKLHHQLIQRLRTPQALLTQYFEKESYTPHLTLGQASHGYSKDDLATMRKLADSLLTNGAVEFKVSYLRVYQRLIEAGDYHKFKDIKLG